jgi:hypothetical protein
LTDRIRRIAMITATCGALAVPALPAVAATPAHHHDVSAPVVVVSGLNNPRQLSLVHNDVLLIAEAGKGGDVGTVTDPEGGVNGLGYTGSISAVLGPAHVHNRSPHRIVTGLLSAAAATDTPAGPKGSGALGPDGVSATSLNKIGIIETTFRPATPKAAKPRDGHLLIARPYGRIRPIADITGYEVAHDPDGLGVDSDPYAVLAFRGGWLVADAAGNDVLYVRHGDISVFHRFRNVTAGACAGQEDPPGHPGCNFVPTSLATDRYGNVYVGGLSSLTPGEAQVVKLDRWGHFVRRWLGFTSVTGLAVGRDGSLYVSQLFATQADPASTLQGVLTRISHGTRTNVDVPFPAGVATDSHGNVFVSAFSILPDTGAGIPGIDTSGQVWRLHF